MDHRGARAAAAWLLAVYCLGLAFVLLNPSAELPSAGVTYVAELGDRLHLPGWLLDGSRVEFAVNAAIFVPLSLLGAVLWRGSTWRDWTAYGFVASCSVEALQGLLLTQRSATFVDVVANTLGALLGGLAAAAVVSATGRRGARRGPAAGRDDGAAGPA